MRFSSADRLGCPGCLSNAVDSKISWLWLRPNEPNNADDSQFPFDFAVAATSIQTRSTGERGCKLFLSSTDDQDSHAEQQCDSYDFAGRHDLAAFSVEWSTCQSRMPRAFCALCAQQKSFLHSFSLAHSWFQFVC